jgi:hypothetical protein
VNLFSAMFYSALHSPLSFISLFSISGQMNAVRYFWWQFILPLRLFIFLSCYGDSFSFPYGSLSSFHVMATVYPSTMALYHPFMLWWQFILSLWLFIILSCYGDFLSFPYGSLSSIHFMGGGGRWGGKFILSLRFFIILSRQFILPLRLFIILSCYGDSLSFP